MFKKVLLSFLVTFTLNAQIFTEKDIEICSTKFSLAVEKNLFDKPINEVVAEIGKSFLETDYVAHALESGGEEKLVINLTGLDCTTFLENALVFSRLIKKRKTTFDDYLKELTFIRYRDGIIDEYPSRLHYFSDWIYNNQQKGIIKDVTKELGGRTLNFQIDFMTAHAEAYMNLKNNPHFIPLIAEQEKEISSRTYYYIPEREIDAIDNKIMNGDLIAFTTNIKGLDISHVGIAVKGTDGKTHLLHAPQVGSKVEITKLPLSDYVKSVKKHTGIIVLRVVDIL
ncbi:MAG TPA: N-acetylmuramoyl-L-alanine amidase-like domain-containing protein [Mariniphaga sp.]|nr:N-acetylmuramoyl-L-alanine amidase-like domain-containing protein [Mariniphaga sp.]